MGKSLGSNPNGFKGSFNSHHMLSANQFSSSLNDPQYTADEFEYENLGGMNRRESFINPVDESSYNGRHNAATAAAAAS